MSDEFKLNRDAGRAVQAESVLNNDMIKEAYETIEADLIKGWINSTARDTDGRERLWTMVHANRKHRDFMIAVINDGKLAEAELRKFTEMAQRKPGWHEVQ